MGVSVEFPSVIKVYFAICTLLLTLACQLLSNIAMVDLQLSPEDISFLSAQTGLKDVAELKSHILQVQSEALDVREQVIATAPHFITEPLLLVFNKGTPISVYT